MSKITILSLLAVLAVSTVNGEYSLKGIKALVYSNTGTRNIIIDGPEDLAEAYEIFITDPKLKTLGKNTFVNIPRLDMITIQNTQLQDIEPETFANLRLLRNINLSGNKIEAIQDGIFNGLEVRNINLTYNKISKIYGNAFNDLPNLRVISLSHNKLHTYNNKWFKSCPMLYRIIMHNNQIQELPANMLKNFQDHADLELWFMNNNIKSIQAKAFDGVKMIRDLWLNYNEIEDINEDTFKDVEINNLQLDNNKIKCISEEVLRGLDVKELDIDWNPLDCKCLVDIRKLSKSVNYDMKTTGRALECMKARIGILLANEDNRVNNKEDTLK